MISLKFLRTHSLFGGLSDEDLKKIRVLMKKETFKKGEVILSEGELGDRLYFIHKGSVEVLKKLVQDKGEGFKKIAVLSEGQTFGEMELIDVQPRAATVRTIEDTEALVLSNSDLYTISKSNLKTFTIIIMNLAREISRKLRQMDDFIASSLFSSSRKKR